MLNRLTHKFKTSEDALAKVGRNSAWLFSSKGVSAVLSLFYLAIVTRALGPAGFGIFILIVSAGQIVAALFRVQTWQAIVQFGTPQLTQGDDAAFYQIAKKGFSVELLGGALACALLFMFMPAVATQYSLSSEIEQGLLVYGLLVLLAFRSTPTGILRAHDRFKDSALGEVAVPVTRMLGAVTVLVLGPDIMGFLIVWGLSELACAALLWILVWRNGRSINKQPRQTEPLDEFEPTPNYSKRNFYAFLAATNFSYLLTIIRERFVVIVVGLFVGATAAGLFRLADQLANSINRLTEVFARPMFAELSRLYGRNQKTELKNLFFRSLRLSVVSGFMMFAALVLLGEYIILIMSGPEFVGAYPLLLVLAGATIIGLISVGLEPLLQAADRATTAFFIRLFSLVLLAALLIWLLPVHGGFGAALALLISAVSTAALLMLIGWQLLRQLTATKS